jgi:cytochrome c-type biogenesis protein CcmH/NrfG
LLPVLEYYPDLPGPQVTMGIACLRSGEATRAEQHLKVALRLNPFNPEIHCNLVQALKARSTEESKRYATLCARLTGLSP